MSAIIAAALEAESDPVARVNEMRDLAKEFYSRKPGPRTKRDRHRRELIGRVASILDEAVGDVEQLAKMGAPSSVGLEETP